MKEIAMKKTRRKVHFGQANSPKLNETKI